MLLYKMSPRNAVSQSSTTVHLLLTILSLSSFTDVIIAVNRIIGDERQCQKLCTTSSCLFQTLEFWKIMNREADPCTNFYEFACGRFIRDTSIIDEESVVSTFSLAQTQISTELLHELNKSVKENDLDAIKKTKTYYQNCMNEGWPVLLGDKWDNSQFDWVESIYKIREHNLPMFFPIIISVYFDNTNSTMRSIKVRNAFSMINRAFLINGVHNPQMTAYFNYMMNVITILGAKRNSATINEMKELLKFEIQLYNITTSEEKLIDIPEAEAPISIRELSFKFPSIPWLELLNKILNPSGIFINDTEEVYLEDPNFIVQIVKLIDITPKRVLANFLSWRITQITLMYMPKKLKKVATDFRSIIDGTKKTMSRMYWCLNEIMEAFPVSLSAMFVRKNFNQRIKYTINEIVENIRNETRKNFLMVDWMDEKTRKAAIEKLDAMTVSIGYAEELMDDQKVNDYYNELQINPGLYITSAFNVTSFLEKQNYRALRRSSNEYLWTQNQNVALVNAYYTSSTNNIEIPTGFLKTFFQSDRPQYINYGTIGTMIGHEIIHGFDNQGRKYDKYGNRKNWWESNTEKNFIKKAKCIVEQYNNYTVPEVGLNVNGQLTQGENIADNGGFKLAYYAYNEWTKRHNIVEGCLPYLPYTPQQMFWISAASNWCSKQRPEFLRDIIATDPHSPYDSRVILSFSNIKEFAKDFNCKLGSKMNPEKKCLIW
ncbi:neprilysin-2-like isoform X2 [Phymastichus coffea]|uniref:neprilysin-2-like isoform X2 n=1 Tax=Phymastichus coffea TaxID=108790 RepID=UPI00273BDB31|nr:neprilysin-2-like isoform X2 [Phymastichus coffea]